MENVRQELEALAEEQRAETTIEFVEPAQDTSLSASRAGECIHRNVVNRRVCSEALHKREVCRNVLMRYSDAHTSRPAAAEMRECICESICAYAGVALELPSMAELTKAGRPSLKKAIYSLGGRQAVARQYNFDCKL